MWYPVGCQSSLQGTPTNVDAMAADATTLSTADNTDPFIPKYTDGTPIQWDGNYAHIDGALYETGRYYKRTGLFQLFFKHRAVALSNGRIAVESFNSVWFTSGRVTDSLASGKPSHDLDFDEELPAYQVPNGGLRKSVHGDP